MNKRDDMVLKNVVKFTCFGVLGYSVIYFMGVFMGVVWPSLVVFKYPLLDFIGHIFTIVPALLSMVLAYEVFKQTERLSTENTDLKMMLDTERNKHTEDLVKAQKMLNELIMSESNPKFGISKFAIQRDVITDKHGIISCEDECLKSSFCLYLNISNVTENPAMSVQVFLSSEKLLKPMTGCKITLKGNKDYISADFKIKMRDNVWNKNFAYHDTIFYVLFRITRVDGLVYDQKVSFNAVPQNIDSNLQRKEMEIFFTENNYDWKVIDKTYTFVDDIKVRTESDK